MKKIFFIFAIITYCFCSLSYASQYDDFNPEPLIDKLIEKIIDNRIYLNPGCVFVAPKDIIIKVEGEVLPIEAVYCDKEGVYVYDYQLSSLIRCETCKRYYHPEKQRPICPHRFRWE